MEYSVGALYLCISRDCPIRILALFVAAAVCIAWGGDDVVERLLVRADRQ